MIKNQNRLKSILRIIENNPGIKFREIMRSTGMKNGVLSHYLHKIEKDGIILVNRQPRQTRYYPLELSYMESKIIEFLRRETPRKIIHALMLNREGLEFGQIIDCIAKSPSTTSLYLSQLVEQNIVKITLNNKKKRYYIEKIELVDRLIEKYHPSMLDKSITSVEDIINSL